jgi:hypothetical protein
MQRLKRANSIAASKIMFADIAAQISAAFASIAPLILKRWNDCYQ